MQRINRTRLRPSVALVASALALWPVLVLGVLMAAESYGTRDVWFLKLGLGAALAFFIGGCVLLKPRLRVLGTLCCIAGIVAGSPIVIYLIRGSGNVAYGLLLFCPNVGVMTFLAYVLTGPDDDLLWA